LSINWAENRDENRLKPPENAGFGPGGLWPCLTARAAYDGGMELVLTLLLVGAALLIAESVLPGMIAGIAGCCCLIFGVIEGYLKFGARTGNLILLGVLAGLAVGFWLWLKYFPDSRLAKLFISNQAVGDIGTERPELLEQTGTALTPLRPAGTAMIDGKRVDVVTEGQMIERGTPVRVVAVEGLRVVVRELNANQKNYETKPG
jgi:membrane-bound serine protease (ClpP class)